MAISGEEFYHVAHFVLDLASSRLASEVSHEFTSNGPSDDACE